MNFEDFHTLVNYNHLCTVYFKTYFCFELLRPFDFNLLFSILADLVNEQIGVPGVHHLITGKQKNLIRATFELTAVT